MICTERLGIFDLLGTKLASRLMLGTARYSSPAILVDAVKASGASVVTASLRHEMTGGKAGEKFWSPIHSLGVRVLPDTAGCLSVSEAVATAKMARKIFGTPWIKLELIGNRDTLQPDASGLVEAARILSEEGFTVFPCTTDNPSVAERLLAAGCKILMPSCAPSGSALGPINIMALHSVRRHFPDVPIIVDGDLSRPSHAAAVMEHGFDAVFLNTAVAKAADPVSMARAFGKAVEAGSEAFGAGLLESLAVAMPSTPISGRAEIS